MIGKAIASGLRRFDAYPKTLEDFRVKTYTGAIVTVVSVLLMVVLFVSELNYYLTKELHPELFVDTSRGEKLKINLDITLPNMPCALLSVDAMDVSGEQQTDVDHDLLKTRLDMYGNAITDTPEKQTLGDISDKLIQNVKKPLDPNRCESCYGAESDDRKCCNTCEDVRDAYRKRGWAFTDPDNIEQCSREGFSEAMKTQKSEGCKIFGILTVNKVAGNFHFAPGRSFQQHHVHVHDLQSFGTQAFNMTHRITHLSFGQDYPGIINPLDEVYMFTDRSNIMFQYFIKIVPTTYVQLDGQTLFTNQFSVTKHSKRVLGNTGEQGLPGLFFSYELSPMMVKYTEKHRSFMHFLTGLCAIIGGIFTVAGLIDSMIYHSSRALQKKIELGKAS